MLIENWNQKDKLQIKATRDGFGEAILELGKQNSNIVVLCADLTESTRVSDFKNNFPERFFEMGLTEQNMALVAAGMALSGLIPFMCSFAVFSPIGNLTQVRVSIAYNQANVKIVSSHSGISVGEDGATHQAIEDIAIMRAIPNMVVLTPCDFEEAKKITIAAAKYNGPVYLRFERQKTPIFTKKESTFEIGNAQILKDGKDVAIIACGSLVYEALLAANDLEKEGIYAMIINNPSIKPLDENKILEVAKKTRSIVTVEDHQIKGGMGSAIAQFISQNFPVPIEFVGINDCFGESGNFEELRAKFNLDSHYIKEKVRQVLKKKGRFNKR